MMPAELCFFTKRASRLWKGRSSKALSLKNGGLKKGSGNSGGGDGEAGKGTDDWSVYSEATEPY